MQGRNGGKLNDLVVRFANVNGTGSASANYLFTKSIFRMGIPVTPKNIFPSNIQGLPTWYEVRVSEKGYLGRRDGVDIMVCVNPQSMRKDVDCVKPGGYFIYDSTKALHPEFIRKDISYLGIPLMEMCNKEFSDPRQRQLFKNIMYVGAIAALLDIETGVFRELFEEQFKGKEKLITPNLKALNMGIEYVQKNFKYPLDIRVERRDLVKNSIMIDGNSACALGGVYGGATVVAWYPITPSTAVAEAFHGYAEDLRTDKATGKKNFAVVQAEDELAALGMVLGASWNGARSFTATSGPGISLMSEFLGLGYFAEIPAVVIDVQRTGPSTGMPTRSQQSDILKAAYASHGDTKNILLLPSNPKECFEMTADALDLAEFFQTPVLVMTDLDLGMNDHMSEPLEWNDKRKYNRGKVLNAVDLEKIERYGRFLDPDNDGVGYRTIPGTHPTKGAYVTRGTSHDEYAVYTEESDAYVKNIDRILKKFHTAKDKVPQPQLYQKKNNSDTGIIFFGTTTYSALEAIDMMRDKGIVLDALRLKAFPFNKTVTDFIDAHKRVFIVEQNRDAQMRSLILIEACSDGSKLVPVLNYDGLPITAENIVKQVSKAIGIPKSTLKIEN
ncbi:MAG: 2-oxoacid:acceptor oxidoreductase subunit alpha [Bacteroidia bacterium]|nr:2-oxoacid:acceptor oxidoreductase subunit alpha [Bacteroidia bacterium]